MSKRETPLVRWFWNKVGGTLCEEFRVVPRSATTGQRLIDALIIPGGPVAKPKRASLSTLARLCDSCGTGAPRLAFARSLGYTLLVAVIVLLSALFLILSFGGTLRSLALNWRFVLVIQLDTILLCELVRLVISRGKWKYVSSERARSIAVKLPGVSIAGSALCNSE
jgi:hypothetical protein